MYIRLTEQRLLFKGAHIMVSYFSTYCVINIRQFGGVTYPLNSPLSAPLYYLIYSKINVNSTKTIIKCYASHGMVNTYRIIGTYIDHLN